jgi:diadenosine tetraphosphatase ApaH/serine/threonine PP2A family protein phosphatase
MNSFNPEARLALQWTEQQLKPDNHAWMDNLPERVDADPVTLVHGSPRQPVWEYLLDTRTATLNFAFFDTPYCFVGHTHLPVLYYMAEDSRFAKLIIPENSTQLALLPRTILNPGSVGQPRDRDPRAAYVILDTDQWICEFHRVPYDIEAVQERMRIQNLPERHIQRLAIGW